MLMYFLTALALVLVIEGLLPFISPKLWRKLLLLAVYQNTRAVRFTALSMMLLGVLILYILHSGLLQTMFR